jgi:hypothetical protein
VATGRILGVPASFVFVGGSWQPSSMRLPPVSDANLRKLMLTPFDSLTFTAVPVGSGYRIGIDRDGDGWADTDELLAHSNPNDPASTPR